MSSFTRLIKFQDHASGCVYFANLDLGSSLPALGTSVVGFDSIESLQARSGGQDVNVDEYLAPVPRPELPIYCVGLNYKAHAEEAKLTLPQNPPLWTKPAAALAHPGEDIPMNKFCAESMPDYEGELIFITSRASLNLTPSQAGAHILGYTSGNDLSCRLFQHPAQSGGQFYFAKAFDKFAPIGPSLVSREFWDGLKGKRLCTRVNGEVVQEVGLDKGGEEGGDMVFGPERVLSWMSQGTTIPAGTVVMTGTPAGVGFFKEPKRSLKHGDVVEVEVSYVGVMRNRIVFE